MICHEDPCSLLKTDICGLRWQWTGGGRVKWLTGWQNHPIPPYCPTIRGSIASSPHTGQTPDQRCAKWILADLWVWVTTLQLKYCQQGRGHNGDWKWIVAIRSNSEIIGTVSRSTEVWREEPVISWDESQYQPALDYVADSQTLNFVKFVVEKSFLSFGSRKEECLKDVNQWRWSITVRDGFWLVTAYCLHYKSATTSVAVLS